MMAAGKKSKTVATEFDSIIQGDRQRRKHAALAEQIFGRSKANKSNARTHTTKSASAGAGSLSDRITDPRTKSQRIARKTLNPTIFKTKQSNVSGARRSDAVPAGNMDADWTHDLHVADHMSNGRQSRRPDSRRNPAKDQGASLLRDQVNIINKLHPSGGMSIRGLAGPYTIIAENFALGTTAEDIQSAMAPIGGSILKCTVNGTAPVTSEITFETKEGADNVIAQFHGQIADGNPLSLYHKIAVSSPPPSVPAQLKQSVATPTGPRSETSNRTTQPRASADHYAPPQRRDGRSRENVDDVRRRNNGDDGRSNNDNRGIVVDGTYGFGDDQMDVDGDNSRDRSNYNNDRYPERRGFSRYDRRDDRPRNRNFR